MESELICVILISVCGVCLEQHVSTLPTSTVHVRAGEDITLHCPLLDVSNATNSTSTAAPPGSTSPGNASSTISWYRQAAGQGPVMLLSVRSNDSVLKYGAGISPDKVSTGSDGSLRLHSSQHSDTAFYYCGISLGGDKEVGRKET
ncbi:secreted immunoglobulin domain 1 [Notolabrus celidotus]|uniref:secreted immunoglobulin domain 1 n=1 Tax=Notolabrus celidotus TaxID=1203425 RepID=UPI00148FE2FD|nr:secreted immunoglobulin domain 1 [Notolabrus celidotus]